MTRDGFELVWGFSCQVVVFGFVAGSLVMARQKIELAPQEAEELSRRSRATTVSVRDRRRAETIVLSAQGLTQQRIAEQLGISRVAVNRWVGRFALHRLDGLTDRAGRGRKPWLPQAAVQPNPPNRHANISSEQIL
jgi:DNA-binding CsgD family transcriptional regulator